MHRKEEENDNNKPEGEVKDEARVWAVRQAGEKIGAGDTQSSVQNSYSQNRCKLVLETKLRLEGVTNGR